MFPKRKKIRLGNYDYSSKGAYFVTVCIKDRQCIFGNIVGGKMKLNGPGDIVKNIWKGLPHRFPWVQLDEYVIMPNHVHGIIMITKTQVMTSDQRGAIRRVSALGEIVRTFKAASTRQVRTAGWTGFTWQRNYYEHVIRNEQELFETQNYIRENPFKWTLDQENPHRG